MKSKHNLPQEIQAKTLIVNRLSGEMYDSIEQVPVNERKNIRIQQDFSDVPSQADQSQRDENDITVMIKKYSRDELALYIAAKTAHKQEIVGHDFSQEPDLQGAMNAVYAIKKQFSELPEEIQFMFRGKPAAFLKFCENPQNKKQLQEWGIAAPDIPVEEGVKKGEQDVPPLIPPKI